jgi:ABC-2 type transport system ATP-binding protein
MIEVTGLTKRFGPKAAVDDLSFSVKKGEVLGFLGPNGAGKSTTMRMVTGFLPATAGEISICDISMIKNPEEAKRKIGYLPESAPLYNDMSVQGFLKFCASMRGLAGSKRREAVARSIETCFLESVARQSIGTLSKGYRHRTCLAQSLLHDPEVLVLFSTHILEEVTAACTRAVIVDQGIIVADGTPKELEAQGGGSLYDLFHKVTTFETPAA